MSYSRYMIQYDAGIKNDHLRVVFQRLYHDVRDIMSDSLKPQWEADDKFIITMEKLVTSRTTEINNHPVLGRVRIESENVEIVETLTIRADSKQSANHIWFLAKHGADFDLIKAMHEAKKF